MQESKPDPVGFTCNLNLPMREGRGNPALYSTPKRVGDFLNMALLDLIHADKMHIVTAVRKHAEDLLDNSSRFKYFTLHGTIHIKNMLRIADLLILNGVTLSDKEAYLLAVSIFIHDLGMVTPLREKSYQEIFEGRDQAYDSANIEAYIRDTHHELIRSYIEHNFCFLSALGVSPSECGLLYEIAKSHRKTSLQTQSGLAKRLGALIRIIDELDIGPARAPISVLRNTYQVFEKHIVLAATSD
jgi:hypothetical protein